MHFRTVMYSDPSTITNWLFLEFLRLLFPISLWSQRPERKKTSELKSISIELVMKNRQEEYHKIWKQNHIRLQLKISTVECFKVAMISFLFITSKDDNMYNRHFISELKADGSFSGAKSKWSVHIQNCHSNHKRKKKWGFTGLKRGFILSFILILSVLLFMLFAWG